MFMLKITAILENKTTAKVELNSVLTFSGAGWKVIGNDSGIDSESSIDKKNEFN
jgi:hypothetical protein